MIIERAGDFGAAGDAAGANDVGHALLLGAKCALNQ
jgi:hypothetical protein